MPAFVTVRRVGKGTVKPEVHLCPLNRSLMKRAACTASMSVAVDGDIVVMRGSEPLLAASRRFVKKRLIPHIAAKTIDPSLGSFDEMVTDGAVSEVEDLLGAVDPAKREFVSKCGLSD